MGKCWVASAADPAPQVSPQPGVETEVEFLTLPAYDITWEGEAPTEIKVGDSLKLRIRDLAPQPLQMTLPKAAAGDLFSLGWHLISTQPTQSAQNANPSGVSFLAVPLKAGRLELPALLLRDPAGKSTGRTRPFTVEVRTAIPPNDPSPDQPEGAVPPIALTYPYWVLVLLAGVTLLLAGGAAYFIYRYWKNRPAKPEIEIPKIKRTEEDEALMSLAELERAGHVAKGNYKIYYFRISEVLKIYIGRRYEFDAPECTTSEMVRTLEHQGIVSDRLLGELDQLFLDLDQVKFTDHLPQRDQALQVMENAKAFVMKTKKIRTEILPAASPKAGESHAVR